MMNPARCTFAIVVALALAAVRPMVADEPDQSAPQDIVATAVSTGDLKIWLAAAKHARLVETLQGEGPFTVFAPTDEAFTKLPAGTIASLLQPENKDKLTAILTSHLVAEQVLGEEITKRPEAKTMQGTSVKIKVEGGKVFIGDAQIVKTDILCSNGVIHLIDEVLPPK